MENDYRKYYLNKPTEVLLQVYYDTSGKYKTEVFSKVEEILVERNVDFEKKNYDIVEENIIEEKSKTAGYLPLILGLLSVALTLGLINLNLDLFTSIFITVVLRLIFIAYGLSLCNDYSLQKGLWITLLILIGGWALIAINIAIIYKTADKDEKPFVNPNALLDLANENIITSPTKTEQINKEYTHCPACLKDMHGKNKCEDCNLEF